MSWNIWGGKYLKQVEEVIANESPDILGLSEVKVQEGVNMAQAIADELGYYVSYCGSFTTDRHTPSYQLGNAILTKIPVRQSSCHFLSMQDAYEHTAATEPRTAVKICLEAEGKQLFAISTHLGFSEKFSPSTFRRKQLDHLLPLLDDRPVILMGDFNSQPDDPVIKTLSQKLQNTDTDLSLPSITDYHDPARKQYRIDYIFVSADISFSHFRMVQTAASDHYPLVVDVAL